MARFRARLARLIRRGSRTEAELADEMADAGDRKEVARLKADYTGSLTRNVGQEVGIIPHRYGRR